MNFESVLRGIFLFNHGRFFEAHEVLEEIWREAPAAEKRFWQGLIQVAVGFHHYGVGNRIGAQSLLARARRNLQRYAESFLGFELSPLLVSLAEWQEALREGETDLPLPRLRFSGSRVPE
jgi:predicted metal-dependent hydrolase